MTFAPSMVLPSTSSYAVVEDPAPFRFRHRLPSSGVPS
jgi:hypothetical protein